MFDIKNDDFLPCIDSVVTASNFMDMTEGAQVIYHLTDKRLIEALNLVHEILHDRMVKQARLLESSEITE